MSLVIRFHPASSAHDSGSRILWHPWRPKFIGGEAAMEYDLADGLKWGLFRHPLHFSSMHMVAATGDPDGMGSFFAKLISICFSLNLVLFTFNLIPLPPLDGSRLPLLFLGGLGGGKHQEILGNPGVSWFGIFVAWKVFGMIYTPIFELASRTLYRLMPGG